MAAAQISLTPSYNGSSGPPSRSISKTRGILIETMQLVEPRKSEPVPNHLLDSKIYSKVAQNSVVQAHPAVLHFAGFELNRTHTLTLQLGNVSGDVQRMHIIPPQTKYFYIRYTKKDRLVPGLTLDCKIEFTPDEWRYYYDCIRIHTKGEENLIIPIHAYPVMNTSDFPQNVTFAPVPVGQMASKTLPLRCHAPIDFEFELNVLQPHPAFTIDPLAGVVPANDEVEITVTFAPTEFSTATMRVQLTISQNNAKPLVCNFFGSSGPGLAKSLTMKSDTREDSLLDPRCISPLDRARSKRQTLKKSKTSSSSSMRTPQIQEVEFAGIKFPNNLDTPYAVAQVLNQEPGKLRIKDLREAVITKKGDKSAAPTRQMKEAMFEMAVRQDVYEERQNQLRWQVRLGDDQINANQRLQILKAREAAWTEYKLKRGDPIEENEFHRHATEINFKRTRRDASNVASCVAQFDTYTNDLWAVRHTAIGRFQQAARKVIIRSRADKKILGLKQMMLDWGNKKYSNTVTGSPFQFEQKEKDAAEEEEMELLSTLPISKDKITSFTFPTYAPPNVKDDMAVDALGKVPYKPTDVFVKKKTPYFNLKVPQQYALMGFKHHKSHDASLSYIPPGLARPLRTGAEDEIITLHAPAPPPASADMTDAVNDGDLQIEEVETPTPQSSQNLDSEAIPLNPPQALFTPIEYPPLHIFNPAPGLQVFQPPLPYAETDQDFHLCPLPRYSSRDSSNPHMATQKAYLDREDVVRGVMSWKRFPSQGLTSLAITPTLTNVWVPRWQDPFSSDLLPNDVPELYDGLAEDDKENTGAEEEEGESLQLTPDMVNAQFSVIDASVSAQGADEKPTKKEEIFPYGNKMPNTNIPVGVMGPVPREKREQELEYFMKKKYNRLGQKIRSKIENMDNLTTNSDLILQ